MAAERGADAVEGIYHQIVGYFADGIRQAANTNVDRPGIAAQPPNYVLASRSSGLLPFCYRATPKQREKR
jgi:hypothetical protein